MTPEELERTLDRLVRKQAELERRVREIKRSDYRIPDMVSEYDIADAVFPPSCFAFNSVTQTISDNVVTAANLNASVWDTNSMHNLTTNNSRLTFNTAGIYLLNGQSGWSANPANGAIYIRKNGNATLAQSQIISDYRAMQINDIRNFVVGEYVQLLVFYFDGLGGTHTTLASAGTYTALSAVMIAPLP